MCIRDRSGSILDLLNGSFDFAGGKLKWDGKNFNIIADSFSLSSGQTINDIAEEKATKEINNFISSIYDPEIARLQAQIDGQIETWYYDYEPNLNNIPASNWKTETDKIKHEGDLFYWRTKGFAYRFFKDGNSWKWQMVQDTDITKALAQAATAQDTADNKRRIFVTTPTPPYDIGDLWVQGESGDIMRCCVGRQTGNYNISDWIKASKYTDDSGLNAFVNGEFKESISDLQSQADKKAETWYQSTDPSNKWTTDTLKSEHKGDLWYNTNEQKTYIYNGSKWELTKTTPPQEVFDVIDGKAQIFVTTPTPPYDIGDLWVQGESGDIMRCMKKRESGSYISVDWTKASKYVDNNAIKEAIEEQTQTDIFNKLTNNGALKGIYMQDNESVSYTHLTLPTTSRV